jgi:small subunit ribosomal protein S4e
LGLPINIILKKELGFTATTKETKTLLNKKSCFVNDRLVKDVHLIVGFMDVITFPEIKQNYRVTLSKKGKLSIVEIDEKEAKLRLSKVVGKTKIKGGKIQINTLDSYNILVKEDKYKTSDSLLLENKSNEIKKVFSLVEGSSIILIGGKHIGSIGVIEKIENNNIFFKSNDNEQIYETLKKFVYVIGDKKPEIKVQ